MDELTPDQIIYETQSFIDSYPHFTVISPASTKYNCYGYALCIVEGSDTVNLGYNGNADIVNCFTLDASSVGCSFNEVSIANNPNIALLVYNNIPSECSHAAITVPGDNNMLISKMNFLPVFIHPKDQLPTFAGQLSLQYGTYHYYKRNYSMSLTGPDLVTSSATYTASYTNTTFNRISWKVEPTELFQDSSGYGLIANLQLKTNPTYLADSATITFYLGHIAPSNNTLDTNSYRISKRFAVQIPTCTISGSNVKSEGFTVKPGATVTITGTIKNYEKAIIKVPVSATLVVNGGKLTNGTTNKMWQGIRVAGNKHLPQSALNQGTIILQNDAIIENARIVIA
ncbi:hypothetical protein LJC25_05010 [Bacteroidales bacterium OttesenSCG-928-K03]|nr:hypothetical protein [Bacteroidales bacterium OttesenSCG-928-K03]